MSDDQYRVEDEINDRKSDIDGWVNSLGTMTIPKSRTGVTDRFIRDCKILITDMYNKETPHAEDLDDFSDRFNSLEIQYFNITESIKKSDQSA